MACDTGKCKCPEDIFETIESNEHFSDKSEKKWYEKINNILIILLIFIFMFGFIYMAFNKKC